MHNEQKIDRNTISFRVFNAGTVTPTYNGTPRCNTFFDRQEPKTEVMYYNSSTNNSYYYEYRYELNGQVSSSNESRLMILLTGKTRSCIDWWIFSTGNYILSNMRLSGFSLVAICTSIRDYNPNIEVHDNVDVYGIYTTFQLWMSDVYYKRFQHYPRLYLFGLSRGGRLSSLLCRVLPIQSLILYVTTGLPSGFYSPSDHDEQMQNRLIGDYNFANWFYFIYCSETSYVKYEECPLKNRSKNYFYPVPPIYFVRAENDRMHTLENYIKMISYLKENAVRLGGTLLNYTHAIQLYSVQRKKLTPKSMLQEFDKWFCKPAFSNSFYEHFINSKYTAFNETFQTCWCINKNLLYFKSFENIIQKWSNRRQKLYRDYIADVLRYKQDLCETLCGNFLGEHAMTSRNIEHALSWTTEIDFQRSSYQRNRLLNEPIRLWMYNISTLVTDSQYLLYHTPSKSRCGRNESLAQQMYSVEYFLQDYFDRLRKSYPISNHNLIWAKSPLLADYFIIPHDYVCIFFEHRPQTLSDLNNTSFTNQLDETYLLPIIKTINNFFPYWNMTSGSNHIIAFTMGRNMGIIRNKEIHNILKNAIHLVFTGFRQDLLPHNAPPLYRHSNTIPYYRHNYDIILPPFTRLQSMKTQPIASQSNLSLLYERKRNLFFFAGTLNKLNTTELNLRQLLIKSQFDLRMKEDSLVFMTIGEKQFNLHLNNGSLPQQIYIDSIISSIYHLCPEGLSPWSPRLYESLFLGAIPMILAKSIVLPFERFIDWRSFSAKSNSEKLQTMIDRVKKVDKFDEYVKTKLKNGAEYFYAFRWPYSSIDHINTEHTFLPMEEMNGTVKNVFYYLSLELHCRRLEQYYGLTANSFSVRSINAKETVCTTYQSICPCYESTSIAIDEYL